MLSTTNQQQDEQEEQRKVARIELDAIARDLESSVRAIRAQASWASAHRAVSENLVIRRLAFAVITTIAVTILIHFVIAPQYWLTAIIVYVLPWFTLMSCWPQVRGETAQHAIEDENNINHTLASLAETQEQLAKARRQLMAELTDHEWKQQTEENNGLYEDEIARIEHAEVEHVSKLVAIDRYVPCDDGTRIKHRDKAIRVMATMRKRNKKHDGHHLSPIQSDDGQQSVHSENDAATANSSRDFATADNDYDDQPQQQRTSREISDDPPNLPKAPKSPKQVDDGPPPKGASRQFLEFVKFTLSLERSEEETDQEKEFEKELDIRTNGKCLQIPYDLRLMTLRGWITSHRHRLKHTVKAIDYIVHWRAKVHADDMLSKGMMDPAAKRFFEAWHMRSAGHDQYGHVIVYDRLKDLDLDYLLSLDDDTILKYHTMQLEMLRRINHETSENRGYRVCKHIYMLDLEGLSLRKHYTSRIRRLLPKLFKLEGVAYSDSLWGLYLLKVPMTFRVIWGFIEPSTDSTSKAKIHIIRSHGKALPEMAKNGIPPSSVPVEFDGDEVGVSFVEWYEKFTAISSPL